MTTYRIAYHYHNLSDKAKKRAQKENKGYILTQFLYNIDGSKFKSDPYPTQR